MISFADDSTTDQEGRCEMKNMNVKALSFSCITDYCLNVGDVDTTHEEVMKNAEKVSKDFVRLVKTVVRKQHK